MGTIVDTSKVSANTMPAVVDLNLRWKNLASRNKMSSNIDFITFLLDFFEAHISATGYECSIKKNYLYIPDFASGNVIIIAPVGSVKVDKNSASTIKAQSNKDDFTADDSPTAHPVVVVNHTPCRFDNQVQREHSYCAKCDKVEINVNRKDTASK